MRFEISYNTGTRHEVELAASVAVLGRDPGCDVVLNDTKCSRRHAIVEESPEGLVIRDAGSANGIRVNNRRVEKALLKPGDTVGLGDVQIKVLGEIGETVIIAVEDVDIPSGAPHQSPTAPQEMPPRPPPAAPPSPPPPRATGPAAVVRRRATAARPPTVGVLSGLWALFAPASLGSLVFSAWHLDAGLGSWAAAIVGGSILAAGGVAMAVGLRAMTPWARQLQVVAAYVGLIVCPLSLAAATVLLYMARPDVRRTFEAGASGGSSRGAGSAEPTFALSIVAMVVVGIALSVLALWLFAPQRAR